MDTIAVIVGLLFIGAICLIYAVSATIALYRTEDIEPLNKLIQGAVSWCIPIVGPMLVLYFIAEHDAPSIPFQWSDNPSVNLYVWQALTCHAKVANELTKAQIEVEVLETVADVFTSDGAGAGDGGGGDGD